MQSEDCSLELFRGQKWKLGEPELFFAERDKPVGLDKRLFDLTSRSSFLTDLAKYHYQEFVRYRHSQTGCTCSAEIFLLAHASMPRQ